MESIEHADLRFKLLKCAYGLTDERFVRKCTHPDAFAWFIKIRAFSLWYPLRLNPTPVNGIPIDLWVQMCAQETLLPWCTQEFPFHFLYQKEQLMKPILKTENLSWEAICLMLMAYHRVIHGLDSVSYGLNPQPITIPEFAKIGIEGLKRRISARFNHLVQSYRLIPHNMTVLAGDFLEEYALDATTLFNFVKTAVKIIRVVEAAYSANPIPRTPRHSVPKLEALVDPKYESLKHFFERLTIESYMSSVAKLACRGFKLDRIYNHLVNPLFLNNTRPIAANKITAAWFRATVIPELLLQWPSIFQNGEWERLVWLQALKWFEDVCKAFALETKRRTLPQAGR